jgi:hypothetical protein
MRGRKFFRQFTARQRPGQLPPYCFSGSPNFSDWLRSSVKLPVLTALDPLQGKLFRSHKPSCPTQSGARDANQ